MTANQKITDLALLFPTPGTTVDQAKVNDAMAQGYKGKLGFSGKDIGDFGKMVTEGQVDADLRKRIDAFRKTPDAYLAQVTDSYLRGVLEKIKEAPKSANLPPPVNPPGTANPNPAPAAAPPANPVPQNPTPTPPVGGPVADQNQNPPQGGGQDGKARKTAAIKQAELEANKAKDDRLAAEARLAAAAAEQRTAEANARTAEQTRLATKEEADRKRQEKKEQDQATDLERRKTELAANAESERAANVARATADTVAKKAEEERKAVEAKKAGDLSLVKWGIAGVLVLILAVAICGGVLITRFFSESDPPVPVESVAPPPVPVEASRAVDQIADKLMQQKLAKFQADCEVGGRTKARCEELTKLYQEDLEKER